MYNMGTTKKLTNKYGTGFSQSGLQNMQYFKRIWEIKKNLINFFRHYIIKIIKKLSIVSVNLGKMLTFAEFCFKIVLGDENDL